MEDFGGQLAGVQVQPAGSGCLLQRFAEIIEGFGSLARSGDRDDVAGPDGIGRDIDLLVIDFEMAVADQFAGLASRLGEPGAVDDVIETHLQELEQVLADIAGLFPGFFEGQSELFFQ